MATARGIQTDAEAPLTISGSVAGALMQDEVVSAACEPPRYDLPETLAKPYADEFYKPKLDESNLVSDAAGCTYGVSPQSCSLIQHAFEMGQGSRLLPEFIGYPALSALWRDGLISACINTLADDMKKCWIELHSSKEGGDPQEEAQAKLVGQDKVVTSSERAKELEQLAEQYGLRQLFHQAAQFNGFFGGALIYIDTGTTTPEKPLHLSEISLELKKERFKGFKLIEPINCTPGAYNSNDPTRDDYYVPREWFVVSRRIHASRLIVVKSGELPTIIKPVYNFLGVPHAQILLEYVLHFHKLRVDIERLASKCSMMVLKTNMDAWFRAADGDAQIKARLAAWAKYRSNDAIASIDKEKEDIVNIQVAMTGLKEILTQALEFVAMIDRKPATKILGFSPSGFNATGLSEARNYADHVGSQCELQREPITKTLDVLQLVHFGKIDPDITFDFRPLDDEDDLQRAQVGKAVVDTVARATETTIISQKESREIINNELGWNLDPDNVPDNPHAGIGEALQLFRDERSQEGA